MKKLTQIFGCLLLPWGTLSLSTGCGEIVVGEPLRDSALGNPSSTGGGPGAPDDSDQKPPAGGGPENRSSSVVDLGAQYAATPSIQASPAALERCTGNFSLGHKTVPLTRAGEADVRAQLVDVNADGLLDQIAILPGEARALLLRSNGEFDEPIVSDVQLGAPSALDAADFNDDGYIDLAAASRFDDGASAVRILLGDGTGQFSDGPAFETLSQGPGCAARDVDGDDFPDLIVHDTGALRFFMNQGDASFVEETSLSVSFTSSPLYHDWDGDGSLDLAAIEADGDGVRLAVFFGDGSGEFMLSARYPLGDSVSETVATGDVDEDGVDDIVVDLGDTKGFTPGIAVLAGRGDGTFEDAVVYGASGAGHEFPDDDLDALPDIWEGRGIVSFGQDARDLNGDGELDVLVVESLYGAYAELRTEDEAEEGRIFSSDIPSTGTFLLGNFIGDSNLDLFIGSAPDGSFGGTHPYLLAQGDGTGTFVLSSTPPGNWRGNPAWAVDLNEDRLSDWVSFELISDVMSPAIPPNGTPGIRVELARGDDTFTANTYALSAPGVAASAGDLNGDGNLDLVVAVSIDWKLGALDVLFGEDDGSFVLGPTTQVQPTDANLTNLFQLADVDRDGALDAVVEIDGNSTWVFHGDGNGSFPRVTLGAFGIPLALGDLNGDGLADLVTEAYAEGRTSYTLSLAQRDGTFGRPQAFYEKTDYVGLNTPTAIHDFDEDGTLDFLHGRTIFRGTGEGTFSCVAHRAPGAGAIADLNGDGALDFVHGQSVGGREGIVTLLGKRSHR